MKTVKYYIALLLAALCILGSCSSDKVENNPSGETVIYKLFVINGDISGAKRYEGTVNEANKTILFTIPAESDVENLVFEGKVSLGAKLENNTFNFLTIHTHPLRVINVENAEEYKVTVSLDNPVATLPFIDKMVVTLNNGTEMNAYVSMADKTVYLRIPNENEATVKSISVRPVRAQVVYTEENSGKIMKANPGKIRLDFMGSTDEYDISFDDVPAFGADFTTGLTYDFSTKSVLYPDFSTINTRSADFDGEHVLIVSRTGGNIPKLFTLADIIQKNVSSPILLNMTGVTGGTYPISSGRLAQGHTYICNLTVGLANNAAGKLKIYHWATPTSAPEMILDFDGTVAGVKIISGRFGDAMTVNLDASGNGYIYLTEQTATTGGLVILRLTVTGFNQISDPTQITSPMKLGMYGSFQAVDSPEGECVLTSSNTLVTLVTKDGVKLSELTTATTFPINGLDARVITFDSERYLIMTTGYSATNGHTFYVYDMTDGINVLSAFANFERSEKKPLFTYALGGGTGVAPSANSGWGVVNGKLYTFASATLGGFSVFEFSEKQ